MSHKNIFTLLLTFWCITGIAQSQEVISTAGTVFENGAGTISFTLGEIVTNTLNSGSSVLTQGFQQSKLTIVSLDERIELEMSVFPNPVQQMITLKVETPQGFQYMLFDISGVLIERKEIKGSETGIDFTSMEPAVYILKVFKSPDEVRTFKIVKH